MKAADSIAKITDFYFHLTAYVNNNRKPTFTVERLPMHWCEFSFGHMIESKHPTKQWRNSIYNGIFICWKFCIVDEIVWSLDMNDSTFSTFNAPEARQQKRADEKSCSVLLHLMYIVCIVSNTCHKAVLPTILLPAERAHNELNWTAKKLAFYM